MIYECLATSMNVHLSAANKQFLAVCANTPDATFILIHFVDPVEPTTVSLSMCLLWLVSVLHGYLEPSLQV